MNVKDAKLPSAASPVRRRPLVALILDQLREFIATARLRPGDRLPPERQLAQQLAVSRPSLRAALDWLSERGALRRVQGGGTYLEPNIHAVLAEARDRDVVERGKVVEVIEARFVLEPLLASLAAERAEDVEIQDLRNDLAVDPASMVDPADYGQHELQFHVRLARTCGNPILVGMLEMLFPHFLGFCQMHAKDLDARAALSAHAEILDAVARRNPAEAAERMRSYLTRYQDILARAEEEPVSEGDPPSSDIDLSAPNA